MSSEVIAAIVSGIFAILAPPVTLLVSRIVEDRRLYPISSDRAKELEGTWEGEALQEKGPDGQPLTAQVTFQFKIRGKRVVGSGFYRVHYKAKHHFVEFVLCGGYLHERFIRLNYDPKRSGIVQFGSLILSLGNHPTELNGEFFGFGVAANKLVHGTIALQKSA